MNAPVAACHYIVEVPASPERIPQVRRIVAAHLRYWGLAPHVLPVCRAVEELVDNVVRHVDGDKTCVVELRSTGCRLVVAVSDRDRRLPPVRSSSPVRGGLARVARLSDSWGTCATEEGKVVWFSRRVREAERVLRGPGRPRVPAVEFRPLPGAAGEAGAVLPDLAPAG
ncbi:MULTISPECIES: ATP-binding protein [Streptomyces]|uniref:Histidine kinase/HSP90-like ATPase domain-containing protein n=1 Tax=Streptomyces sanyensis TaxID=568869 RepID=A0ABP9B7B8_9ACTN